MIWFLLGRAAKGASVVFLLGCNACRKKNCASDLGPQKKNLWITKRLFA